MLLQCVRPLWPLLFLLAVCSGHAAPVDMKSAFVTVKVVDASGTGVRNAEVHFVERSSRVRKVQATDGVGNATVELDSGEYELTVTSPGLKSFVMRFEVKRGKNQQLDVALRVEDCPPGSCGDATLRNQRCEAIVMAS
jgi:Carboxypeptidase regulatory-like domain